MTGEQDVSKALQITEMEADGICYYSSPRLFSL